MKLHIFNPEHDMALVQKKDTFTPSHSVRELNNDLAFLPALWADDGDLVLVPNVQAAVSAVRHIKCYVSDVVFVTSRDISPDIVFLNISPWGWDKVVCNRLSQIGIDDSMLPTEKQLSCIRDMSNRRWAATYLLSQLVRTVPHTIGSADYITEVSRIYAESMPFVLKAPWSSSGRGIRYVENITTHIFGWTKNIIKSQGGVMIEPYYNKIKDFALEFESSLSGISYLGLSLFNTANGAYSGNILASEQEKRHLISKYISLDILDTVIERIISILSDKFRGLYYGPFGIDMMIVSDSGVIKLHPCVELNLRRTMGHVALSFNISDTEEQKLMRISYENGFHLRIMSTRENLINNSLV